MVMSIPNNNDNDCDTRMNKFIACILRGLETSSYKQISDYSEGNHNEVPGITEEEARTLARLFVDKGYHAKAYYIDYPSHGFRYVEISKHICSGGSHRNSHSVVWG